MPYIGSQQGTSAPVLLDAISVVNGQAAYTLQKGGLNYTPASALTLQVSLNGIVQGYSNSFSVSGSTITFDSALVTGDVIDYILDREPTTGTMVPLDGSVTDAKIATVSASKLTGALPALDGSSLTGIGVAGISSSSTSGTALSIDSSNRILTPARPSFCARGYVGAVSGQGYEMTSYFNTVDHNIGSHFDNSSTTGAKFTAPVAGVYHFNYFMGLRGAYSNFLGIHLEKNGSAFLQGWSTSTMSTVHDSITIASYMQLAVGDIIRVGWYSSYNAPSTGINYGGFSGCFIG